MPTRTAKAVWTGDLESGQGNIEFGGGAYKGNYSFASRFEHGKGTNPEELIAAAHAGCFAMALSHGLAEAGYQPQSVEAKAKVKLEQVGDGFKISTSHIDCIADVPDISESDFSEQAEAAKVNCPVSKVLAGANISLTAELKSQ